MDLPTQRTPGDDQVSRRTLVAGAGALVGVAVLAGCADDGTASAPAEGSSAEESTPAESGGSGGAALASVSDVPVGGAISARDSAGKPIIIAQPSAGEVVAFSAICTHKGCTVEPEDKIVKCPCHGSTYDLTGANTGGPAPSPLAAVEVVVEGDRIMEA